MASDIQVLLVGGRQAPNVIGVLTQRPRIVELLVSKDEREDVVTSLCAALQSIQGVALAPAPQRVDACDFAANLTACREICSRYKGRSVAFNLTGSHKIMAISAYQVARDCGASAFYVDTATHRILSLVGGVAETDIALTIEQYLSAYGRAPVPTFDFGRLSFDQAEAIEVARLLATGGESARELAAAIRRVQGGGRRTIALDARTRGLAERIAGRGALDLDATSNVCCVRGNDDWNFFTGGWLEVHVWHETRRQQSRDGRPLYDECALSLEIPMGAARKEIDVIGLYQAQVVLCSCKAEAKPFRTETLDELSAVANLIGGRYCSRVFATDGQFMDAKKRDEFLAQARQREIVIVTGERLAVVGDIMAKQAMDPDYRRV